MPNGTARSGIATAILFMVGATAAFAASTLIAKGLAGAWSDPLHPLQVTAGRFWGALLPLVVISACRPIDTRPTLRGVPWRLHLARTACGFTNATLLFAAAARMPLGEATALSFLSPLVTMALAVPLLGDRIGPRQTLAAAVSVAGMLVLLRPGHDAVQPAALLALAAAVFMGLESILIKQLADREPPLRMLLVNNAIGATVAIPVAFLVWRSPGTHGLALMTLVGVAMVIGQSGYIQALRRARVSTVVPAFYLTLVFAALYDFVAFGVVPDGPAVAGASLIVTGALVLALSRSTGRRAAAETVSQPARSD